MIERPTLSFGGGMFCLRRYILLCLFEVSLCIFLWCPKVAVSIQVARWMDSFKNDVLFLPLLEIIKLHFRKANWHRRT